MEAPNFETFLIALFIKEKNDFEEAPLIQAKVMALKRNKN